MEPMAFETPAAGYLEGLIDMAHAEGALVVFDEMVTGLRLANGGAQELFGATPDLACFGKALANGMPLSALVGAAEYMKLLPSVAYGMTFRGETLSLAAARAVLCTLREQPVAPQVERIGGELRRGFERACAEAGVGADLLGHESRMTFAFHDQAGIEREQAHALFLEGCAEHGILTNGNLLPSAAHDDEAVERTVRGFEAALSRIGGLVADARRTIYEAIESGFRAAGEDAEEGQAERWSGGFLDLVRVEPGRLEICGWLLREDGPPEVVEAVHDDGAIAVGAPTPRPDVAQVHTATPGAGAAGFNLSLPARDFARGDDYSFTLRARRGDHVLFSCRMARVHSEHQSAEHRPTWGEDGTLHL
jgi:hypothetical protein